MLGCDQYGDFYLYLYHKLNATTTQVRVFKNTLMELIFTKLYTIHNNNNNNKDNKDNSNI